MKKMYVGLQGGYNIKHDITEIIKRGRVRADKVCDTRESQSEATAWKT